MSHFAKLDDCGFVEQVIVSEWDFINSARLSGTWVPTSYNSTFGGKFAAIGDKYDFSTGTFISPQPYPSWIRDGSYWKPPIDYPSDEQKYQWDECILNWVCLSE